MMPLARTMLRNTSAPQAFPSTSACPVLEREVHVLAGSKAPAHGKHTTRHDTWLESAAKQQAPVPTPRLVQSPHPKGHSPVTDETTQMVEENIRLAQNFAFT